MSDKNPPSLDHLLKGVLDFTNTQKRVSEQIEILRKPMYIAKRQNITIPNPSEVLKSFQTTRELLKSADTLAQPYLDKGIIISSCQPIILIIELEIQLRCWY